MALSQLLTSRIEKAIEALFGITVNSIELQATRREFEGDITMVIFPLLKLVKSNPVALGTKIGEYLVEHTDEVVKFNVVSGFLNLVIADDYYINFFNAIKADENFGFKKPEDNGKAVVVEYASPNTNKPLHLGHVRNVLLGYSVAEIIKASGKKVYKTQIINDRGIHICKSMLAYKKFAPNGKDGKKETPQTTFNDNIRKGDKFVGYYYVEYDKAYKDELREKSIKEIQSYVNRANKDGKWLGLEKDAHPIAFAIQKGYEKALKEYLKETLYLEDLFLQKNDFYFGYYVTNDTDLRHSIDEKIQDFRDYLSKSNFITFDDNKALCESNPVLCDILNKYSTIIIKEISSNKDIVSTVNILMEAQNMLRKWEAGDEAVVSLWETMNGWVYEGFDATFKNIGVDFDKNYYESNTYLLGKDVVEQGLAKGVFEKDPDGSVWIDLTDEGLDRKIVLRSDGTAVYMTQDIGTAIQRVKDFPDVGGMVYTVGNEQDYHFKVLFLILKKLGFDWADSLYHLSYGMVDLPSGKMKSREGTVVDADDLMDEMIATAQKISEELGKLEGYSDEEKAKLYNIIGLGALKYYILKVDPKKRILFNPEESVDFAGNTGPFIQYTYARIQSLLRKADFDYTVTLTTDDINLHEKEKALLKMVAQYPDVIQNAADSHSPALVANYTYELVKEYNSFYQTVPVLGSEVLNEKIFRIQLSKKVGETIKSAFGLLGIGVPERM
mgnify:CR=1 FL=1